MQFGKQLPRMRNKNTELKDTATTVANKAILATTIQIINPRLPQPQMIQHPESQSPLLPPLLTTRPSMMPTFEKWHVMLRSLMLPSKIS